MLDHEQDQDFEVEDKMKSKKGVEEALKIVGSFGRFQALCFCSIASFHIFLAWQMVLLVFAGANPKLHTSSREVVKAENGLDTIVSEWNLHEKTWIVSAIQSVFMLGVMIGNFIFGQLSDLHGRKSILYKAFGFLILLSFLSSFANNYVVFGIIRFLTGVFEGGTVLVSFVLAQELLGSSVWTITGNIIPALFALGVASLAGIASQCLYWRDLCWATSLPGVLLWLSVLYVPESPRWLFSQGRLEEAQRVLTYIALKNGVSAKQCNELTLHKISKDDGKVKKTYTLRDLFGLRTLMIRTLVMGYLWFVCSFTYYGLTMGAGDLSSSIFTSVALSGLVELPAYVICAFLIDRTWAGRRKTLVGMLLFCGFSCIAIMFVHSSKGETSTSKLGLAMGGKLAVSASFSIVYIYASELFPTVVRNVGMGSSSVCARLGGILAPFVPTLGAFGQAIPYVVFGLVALIAGVLTLLLPETLHQPIPDSIEELTEARPQSSGTVNRGYIENEESLELLA